MNWQAYHKSLLIQRALLKEQIESSEPFGMTPEKETLILMLGCVETQMTIVNKAILTENDNQFDIDESRN